MGAAVIVVRLVHHLGTLGEHREAVGEAARDQDLATDRTVELHGDVPAEGRGTPSDIDHHVEDVPVHDLHQLGLRRGILLEMQAADDAPQRRRQVVLHPVERDALLLVAATVEALQEHPPVVAEEVRLDDEYAGEICAVDPHGWYGLIG
jgi:hypothetical protein